MIDAVAAGWEALSRGAWDEALELLSGLADDDARAALERDLVELVRRFDRLDGDAVAIPSTYTEAIAITR